MKVMAVAGACLFLGLSATSVAVSGAPDLVRKVEEALAAQGYDPGPIDGVWTAKTEEAVKKAQKDREFEPTGQLDQRTVASIGIRDADNPFMREPSASAGATKQDSEARASPAPSRGESSSR